jgi:acetyltransferase-like isoleucine patch superfamily enzyme
VFRNKIINPVVFETFGQGSVIANNCTILTPSKITIGKNVFIGERAHITARLIIKDNVMIGPRSTIIGGSNIFGISGVSNRFIENRFACLNIKSKIDGTIQIDKDVWCGANVTILKNSIIGYGAIIGAGALIYGEIAPFTVNVGSPAQPIKKIFSDTDLRRHLSLLKEDRNAIEDIISKRKEILTKKKKDEVITINNDRVIASLKANNQV